MSIELSSGHLLQWVDQPGDARLEGAVLTMRSGPRSDWFKNPVGSAPSANAPVLASPVEGDCQLSARVRVDFGATFDAGVLFVHQSADHFAKLCFERAPTGENTIVSVVTRAFSDDATGPTVEGNEVLLRISKFGAAIAFHWSPNNGPWSLLRYFRMSDPSLPTAIGFCSQSPTGDGCTSSFSEISWTDTSLADVRDGS